MDTKTKLIEIIKTQKPELAANEILRLFSVVWRSEQLCECDTPLIRTNIKGGEYCALCGKELC